MTLEISIDLIPFFATSKDPSLVQQLRAVVPWEDGEDEEEEEEGEEEAQEADEEAEEDSDVEEPADLDPGPGEGQIPTFQDLQAGGWGSSGPLRADCGWRVPLWAQTKSTLTPPRKPDFEAVAPPPTP